MEQPIAQQGSTALHPLSIQEKYTKLPRISCFRVVNHPRVTLLVLEETCPYE